LLGFTEITTFTRQIAHSAHPIAFAEYNGLGSRQLAAYQEINITWLPIMKLLVNCK